MSAFMPRGEKTRGGRPVGHHPFGICNDPVTEPMADAPAECTQEKAAGGTD